MWTYVSSDALYHHGIKGQRWGVRRFQNKDGTLTAAGRRRAEGAREDAASYKYQKPGESGWVGMKRAVKAKQQAKADKKRAEAEEIRRIGAMEDAQSFKYQKPGESGWVGAKRAIKAKLNKSSNDDKQPKSYVEAIKDEHKQRARNSAKVSAVTGASSIATAAVTAAGVTALSKRGKTQAAATLYAYGTHTTQYLKAASGATAVNAGLHWYMSSIYR